MNHIGPAIPLGELLAKSDDWIDLDPTAAYREVTVRLWGNGVVLRREAAGDEIKSNRRLRVRPGQFILSRIDARNGAFGLIPDDLDGAVVSNDFPVFIVRADRLLPEFLGWMSKTRTFVDLCRAASEGTTNRVRLKEDRFLRMTIPLPPLSEQRRIVAKIEQLAAKIDEARRLRERSDEATAVLWRSSASETLHGVPRSHWRSLADVVGIRGGGTPSKNNPAYWGGSIPWICPRDMKQRDIVDSSAHITEAAVRETNRVVLEPGTVLVVVRGMILAHTFPSAVLRVRGTINQDMKALVTVDGLLPEYLSTVFWGLNPEIVSLVGRSGHDTRKLLTDKLLAFEIPAPPLGEQRRIVAYLDDLQAKVDRLKALQYQTAAELDALLPSVLDKAFKGEL